MVEAVLPLGSAGVWKGLNVGSSGKRDTVQPRTRKDRGPGPATSQCTEQCGGPSDMISPGGYVNPYW